MTIAEYLKSKKLTGLDLALAAGLDPATISRLLNGIGPRPSWQTVEKIRKATGGAVVPPFSRRKRLSAKALRGNGAAK